MQKLRLGSNASSHKRSFNSFAQSQRATSQACCHTWKKIAMLVAVAFWSRKCIAGRALESEGFSTWGVWVAENFNDSGQTFCSPIVTVCATNVRKRHTSRLTLQEMIMAIQTGDSALTCIPSHRGHSRSAASLGLITQPTHCECNRSGLLSLKFPFAHSGWHCRCSVALARVDPECWNRHYRHMIWMFLHKDFSPQTRAGVGWLVNTRHSTDRLDLNE